MALSVGIVGLPNSGKSTLFNALLSRQIAQVASYPFTTIEPHEGVVALPDERLEKISEIVKPEKTTPATVTFIDIAGLVKDAHKGEGLGNQFLAKIREVDAIAHVVRAFENPDVPHYYQTIDFQRDIEIVNLELELAGIKKPTLYVLNISENQIESPPIIHYPRLPKPGTGGQASSNIQLCAKLEMELAELNSGERKEYLHQVGIKESGLEKLIKEAYKILGLITFYTVKGTEPSFAKASEGRGEVRAWSLRDGETALRASSLVHSDFAKGFIKAEVINCNDLLASGSWQKASEAGKIRLEGKDYQVQDGNVIEFKFHS